MIKPTKKQNVPGFTLIEIIIVIAVMSILSTIMIISYSSWQKTSFASSVKSDLMNASAAMENARNYSSGYPTSLSGIYESSSGVIISVASSDAKNYCIDAVSSDDNTVTYYVSSKSGSSEPQSGTCAGMPGAITTPTGLSASTASATTISLNWNATVPGATGYTLQQSSNAAFSDAISIGSFGASPTLPYVSTGLSSSTTYYYRVQAFSATNTSPWSTAVSSSTSNSTIASPSTPVVTNNTVSSTTTFSWLALSCAADQKIRYRYQYTISPSGYNSGWIDYGKAVSIAFTTSTEGQTYTITAQAQCYSVIGVSSWTSSGSASYYRLIRYTLTTAAGTGGTVSAGGTYNEGTTQTITATPSLHFAFNAWTGSTGCSGVASHTILMNSAKSCTASFTQLVYVVDSYSETNYSWSESYIFDSALDKYCQSFTSDGGSTVSCKFMLDKSGLPTGSAYAEIYNLTGTFGTTSIPTGAPLATSDAFNVATLTTTPQLITFNFTGVNKIKLTNGSKYFIVVRYGGGVGVNYVLVGEDNSSPTHAGNHAFTNSSGSWVTTGIAYPIDFIFYVYNG